MQHMKAQIAKLTKSEHVRSNYHDHASQISRNTSSLTQALKGQVIGLQQALQQAQQALQQALQQAQSVRTPFVCASMQPTLFM